MIYVVLYLYIVILLCVKFTCRNVVLVCGTTLDIQKGMHTYVVCILCTVWQAGIPGWVWHPWLGVWHPWLGCDIPGWGVVSLVGGVVSLVGGVVSLVGGVVSLVGVWYPWLGVWYPWLGCGTCKSMKDFIHQLVNCVYVCRLLKYCILPLSMDWMD